MKKDEYRFTKTMEGLRLKPYKCPAGKLTIGYGHNLEDNGVTEEIADALLDYDMLEVSHYLTNYCPYVSKLHNVWQAICKDMVFNLGGTKFKSMKRLNQALVDNNPVRFLVEMIDSAWFKQVGNRSKLLWLCGYWLKMPDEVLAMADKPPYNGNLTKFVNAMFPSCFYDFYNNLDSATKDIPRLKKLYNSL